MGHYPNKRRLPITVNSFGSLFVGGAMAMTTGLSIAPSSVSWGTANDALYIPFFLPWPYPVERMFWGNGSTTTGNGCCAIYSWGGSQIVTSGSIARTPASGLQYVTVGMTLPAGGYWFGLSINATTTAVFGSTSVTAVMARLYGIRKQASALPLPATATFAAPTNAVYPLVGITRL